MRLPGVQILSFSCSFQQKYRKTRKHSSRMCTDRAITRMSSDRVAMRPIVDRQTPVKTLPSLAVGNNRLAHLLWELAPSPPPPRKIWYIPLTSVIKHLLRIFPGGHYRRKPPLSPISFIFMQFSATKQTKHISTNNSNQKRIQRDTTETQSFCFLFE